VRSQDPAWSVVRGNGKKTRGHLTPCSITSTHSSNPTVSILSEPRTNKSWRLRPLVITLAVDLVLDGAVASKDCSSVFNLYPLMSWPHEMTARLGVWGLRDILGARCVFTSFYVLLNTERGGFNLTLEPILLRVRAEFSFECIFFN
jgi:hypothetical protein